jgi:PKD repeat protein
MKKITFLFAIALMYASSVFAQFTATYTFDSVKTTSGIIDPSPLPSATGMVFGSFSSDSVSLNPNAAGKFSFTKWGLGSTNANDLYSTFTGALDTNKYYEVTVAPASGYSVTLSSIAFSVSRSGTGIRNYSVRSSADGYTTNLAASINPTNTKLSVQTGDIFLWNLDATVNAQNGSTITLSGANFTNITNAVTFRIFAWNAESTAGSFILDNVAFTGVATLLVNPPFTAMYPFDSVKTTSGTIDPTPVPTSTGIVFGSFVADSVSATPNANTRFSYTKWGTGATSGNDVYASLTGALNPAKYYEVTVTPVAGYYLTVSSINFSVQRSGTGIRTYSVRSSADNYSANLPASINPTSTKLSVQSGNVFFINADSVTSNQDGSTINLSGSGFTNSTQALTFRFYGWNSETSLGTFSIDNVTISGVAIPAVIADFTGANTCQDDTAQFTDMSVSGFANIKNWYWNFGDPSTGVKDTSSMQNPTHVFSNTGDYSVMLVVTDSLSNVDSITKTFSVFFKPLVQNTVQPIACAGPVQFSNGCTGATNVLWNFGDPTSGVNDTSTSFGAVHTYLVQATYNVTLIGYNGTCSTSGVFPLFIDSLGAAFTYTQNGNVINFHGSAFNGMPSYNGSWYFGDPISGTNNTSLLQNPVHTYSTLGVYNVCLTMSDGGVCSDSVCHTITILTTGIENTDNSAIVTIYPNPSSNGIFNLNLGSTSSKTTVTVYNIIGKIILTKEISSTNKQVIDLSDEANGSYFINIKNDNENVTKKLTINK